MLNKSGVDGFLIMCKLSGQQRAYSFPWQPITLNNGGVLTKYAYLSSYSSLNTKFGTKLFHSYLTFFLIVRYANYHICIYIIIYENMRN